MGLDLTGAWYDAASYFNSDPEYGGGRTSDSVTTNAIDSMQPIDSSGATGWGGFWQGFAKTATQYALAKDMATTNAALSRDQQTNKAEVAATVVALQNRQGFTLTPGMLIMLAVGGALVFVVANKG